MRLVVNKKTENTKVLIVEDEMLQMTLLEKYYNHLGCQIVAKAASADEAIKAAKLHQPDIISMDIFLEGNKNGIQATEEIRKFSDVPVIYITGNSDSYNYEKAKKTNFTAYLIKPVMMEELQDIITRKLRA